MEFLILPILVIESSVLACLEKLSTCTCDLEAACDAIDY